MMTTVMLGSLVLDVLDVPEVGHDDWAELITALVDGFRAQPRARATRRAATSRVPATRRG
jgi:hypothetical protein